MSPPSKESRNLARLLEHHRIDLVLDVGGNSGQYGQRLRRVKRLRLRDVPRRMTPPGEDGAASGGPQQNG